MRRFPRRRCQPRTHEPQFASLPVARISHQGFTFCPSAAVRTGAAAANKSGRLLRRCPLMGDRCEVEAILDEVARGRTEAFGRVVREYALPLRSYLASQVHRL